MSRGYPSMERARKAYWRGARDARRPNRGPSADNPYLNPKLADLWRRGRDQAMADPNLKVPPQFGRQHEDKQRPRPDRGPGGTRHRDPRDFDRGGGRGGW